jgi:hypothetical protein
MISNLEEWKLLNYFSVWKEKQKKIKFKIFFYFFLKLFFFPRIDQYRVTANCLMILCEMGYKGIK